MKVMAALGNLLPTISERNAAVNELKSDSESGHERRGMLKDGLEALHAEEHGLGIEMNQRYSSSAVWQKGVGEIQTFSTDARRYYHPTTKPGARLPHVWLNTAIPSKRISTIDLAGKGKVFVTHWHWRRALEDCGPGNRPRLERAFIGVLHWIQTGLRGHVYRLGPGSGMWRKVDVCLLDPDYFVAWRAKRWEGSSSVEMLRRSYH